MHSQRVMTSRGTVRTICFRRPAQEFLRMCLGTGAVGNTFGGTAKASGSAHFPTQEVSR
jgi:hypothetical protein